MAGAVRRVGCGGHPVRDGLEARPTISSMRRGLRPAQAVRARDLRNARRRTAAPVLAQQSGGPPLQSQGMTPPPMGPPLCLHQEKSDFNENIQVLQFPLEGYPPEVSGARLLFLDHSGNVHSVYRPGKPVSSAYWDELGAIDALVPQGPIALLGLAAGTTVHLIHSFSPSRVIHGWELDGAVVRVAKNFLGLNDLEEKGSLVIHVADALTKEALTKDIAADHPEAAEGFAGIIVDIFIEASVHPDLLKVETWKTFAGALRPGGRVIANLGSAPFPGAQETPAVAHAQQALAAMAEASEGQLCYKYQMSEAAGSTLGLSGPLPAASEFESLPKELQACSEGWKMYGSTSFFQDVQ